MFHKQDSSVLSKGKKSVDVPLKKSDCKKLMQTVHQTLGGIDNNNNNDKNEALVSSIFMNGSLMSRKLLHPQLHKVVLYFRLPSSANGKQHQTQQQQQDATVITSWPFQSTTQCVWMTIDVGPSQLIHVPTVALLSVLLPSSSIDLPTVVVPSAVSKFVCRGAHIMRAGILSIPTTSTNHGIVAIKVHGNPQAFAVGKLTKDTTPQTIGDNARGVGVKVYTCYGDDLWKQQQSQSHSAQEGIINPMGGACFDNGNYGNVGFMEGKIVRPIVAVEEDSDDDDDDDESPTDASSEAPTKDANADSSQQEQEAGAHDETLVTDDSTTNTADTNDAILHQAMCEALVNIKDSQLPMTSTNLYAQHVKPRFSTPTIDIKSTSWKKFNTYLQYQMESNEQLVTCKAHGTDPMGYLTAIDRQHPDLRGRKKDVPQDGSCKKKVAIVALYIVPHHFVDMLRLDRDDVKAVTAKSEERCGTGMLTVPEARAILDTYITKNKVLTTSSDVRLDAALTHVLFKKERAPPESLSKKELYKRWLDKMNPAYAIVEMPGSRIQKLGRGQPPKVLIEVSLRQGRKKYSTKVRGLEDYDIDPVAFSRDVTRRFACSSTIETEPVGRAALKKGHVELDFQGHLLEELRALLLGDEKLSSHGGAKDSEYCLPKNSIEVVLKKNVPSRKPRK